MKKKKVFSVVSWLYFIAGLVLTPLFITFSEPTGGNLMAGCMFFTLCMLGAIGYRSSSKTLILLVVSSLFFTSCSPKGYGCKGRQSWNKMVERNNRFN
jgi:hypothetical protein